MNPSLHFDAGQCGGARSPARRLGQAFRSRSAAFVLGLLLLAGGWLVAFAYLAVHLREDQLNGTFVAGAQHALHFEQQLSSALEMVELTASGLDAIADVSVPSPRLNAQLLATTKPLPFLRSLSIVDRQVRVVASSNDANVGVRLALDGFFPDAGLAAASMHIGPPWRGRDVGQGGPAPDGQTLEPDEAMILPVLRRIASPQGEHWVLAALNPDHFLVHAGLMLDPREGHALWLRFDGMVLLSGDLQGASSPGSWDDTLAQRVQLFEQGRLEQVAPDGRALLTAYRASSRFPALLAVRMDRAHVLQRWGGEMQRLALLLLPVLLALGVALGVYQRYRWGLQRKQQELDRANRLGASVFRSSRDAIMITDIDARIVQVNAAFEAVTGWGQHEVLGANPRLLSSGEQPSAFYRAMWEALARDGHWQGELLNRRKNGQPFHARLSIVAVHGADGRPRHYTGVLADISEHMAAAERLQLAAGVFSHASEGIMITDPQGGIIDVNAAFTEITGYTREEVVGRNARLLKSGRQDEAFYAEMWRRLADEGEWSGEVWNRRKDGSVYSELLKISSVRDANGAVQRYVALFSDITQNKEYEAQLVRVAHFDALTGLPNRVLLAVRLRQAMAQVRRNGGQLAVVFLDLDGFKAVNDTHGHEAGDRLLVELSRRMRDVLREEDTLARIGGDEFVGVLTGIADPMDSVHTLERLLQVAARPVLQGRDVLQVSASVGVTFFPQGDDVDAEQLLRQADQAMYQAKLAGKHRFRFFDAEQDRDLRARHQSVERLHQALERDEFVLHYQPRVNMRTGQVLGMEALLRWQHPVEGLVHPADFLPALQGHPLMVELGNWVLAQAMGQVARWKAQGLHLPVSVNVDPVQLGRPDFVEQLSTLLREHPQVVPGDLSLELLETSALSDMDSVSRIIVACRELGVSFALDDFGIGYSSLQYLRHLPARELKIDRSFVCNMLTDIEDLTILDGVIALSVAFRRQVIAEGVETPAHGQLLLRLGCDWGQGYAIAPPMPANDVPGWVLRWRPDPAWHRVHRLRRDDLTLLFVEVEYRRCIQQMLDGLAGQTGGDVDQTCQRLQAWINAPEGGARYRHLPGFDRLLASHAELQALIQRLRAPTPAMLGATPGVHAERLVQVRDDLLGRLHGLVATEG